MSRNHELRTTRAARRLAPLLAPWCVALAAAGCKGEETVPPAATPDMGVPPVTGGDAGTGPAFATSAKARVQIKRREQIATDWSAVLEIPSSELCNELGRYNCFEVHAIPLGGTEPYNVGIFEPLEATTVTTPLAVDRIALAACATRVDRDGGRADGVIFKDIAVTDDTALADPDAPEVRAAIDRLYTRALSRPMTDREWSHHRSLYDEAVAASEPAPARAWAILSCFSVLTSVEALFY